MLQRQSQWLAILLSPTISREDHTGFTQAGRKNMVSLAQRMNRSFCSGVCSTMHLWQRVEVGDVGEDTRIMVRVRKYNPGGPSRLVLSATTSVWMPVSQQLIFNFLRDEQMRGTWDEFCHGRPTQQMVFIAEDQGHGNFVSLIRATAVDINQNQRDILILQETQTDASGSIVVYTALDISAVQLVMSGGDSSSVAILPSGFAIADSTLSTPNLLIEYVNAVKNLLSQTIEMIRAILCN